MRLDHRSSQPTADPKGVLPRGGPEVPNCMLPLVDEMQIHGCGQNDFWLECVCGDHFWAVGRLAGLFRLFEVKDSCYSGERWRKLTLVHKFRCNDSVV